ncbi:hypothetical protein ACLMJK_006216 [Lecanora helva]
MVGLKDIHGNAGTVAQGWRTDTYRALSSSAPDNIHVLTVDYRGYGLSTGSPSEAGLIADGIAVARWAIDVAKIPPARIVLLGQSLGTAVATAVAERFIIDDGIEFKGILLIAAFSDIPTLMSTYAIGGVIPILSPLRPYPFLQRLFAKGVQETWFTAKRLEHLVRKSKNINLQLIHSKNDFDIPWTHSNTLFYAAANATSKNALTSKLIDATKIHQDLGGSGHRNVWKVLQNDGGQKIVTQDVVHHGVSRAIFRMFFERDFAQLNDFDEV